MTTWNDVKHDDRAIKLLDHGFVVLMDIMGSDADICQAARCSYGKGTKSTSDDRALIRYLMRNWHTSPLEMVELKFLIKMPIFVMRQHVRHRTASLNEYSGRYSEMTDEMYVPDIERFQGQHADNKQASGASLPEDVASRMRESMTNVNSMAYNSYMQQIEQGLAREVARVQLPVSNYTELYWKIDLKNFLHYVFLRDDEHAQQEIRVFAEAMFKLVKPLLPQSCEAFEDYWSMKNTARLSRMELDMVRKLINKDAWANMVTGDNKNDAAEFGISVKELNEFKAKMCLA